MKVLLAAVILVLGVGSATAQDTCKTIVHKNPHGAAMTISRVWILDSANFTVRPIQQLPYQESATGSFDFEVCIIPRDGKTYSTQVRYQTTHGPVSYNVSNFLAPLGTSSVTSSEYTPAVVFPNPVSSVLHVQVGEPFEFSIVDINGIVIIVGRSDQESSQVDVSRLTPGSYTIRCLSTSGEQMISRFIKQ